MKVSTLLAVLAVGIVMGTLITPMEAAPNWYPISRYTFAYVNMHAAGVHQSFSLPSSVSYSAKEVLLFVTYRSGNCNPQTHDIIQIYTDYNHRRYSKYLQAVCYAQQAWNSNSENMWLPVSPGRKVYVVVPSDHNGANRYLRISAIGYRY